MKANDSSATTSRYGLQLRASTVVIFLSSVTPSFAAALFAVTHDSRITEYDADTGAILNSFPTPFPLQSNGGEGLAYSGSTLFYTTTVQPMVAAVDPATGAVLRTLNLAGVQYNFGIDALGYGPSNFGNTLFALEFLADRVRLINPLTGDEFANYFVNFDAVGGIDYDHATGTLYVSDATGGIHILNPNTGAQLGSFATPGFEYGVGLVGNRLFTSMDSTIVERDPLTGVVLHTFPTQHGLASALAGGPVPEPSSSSMSVLGFVALLIVQIARQRLSVA
jgi:outer membrane protein assembly factor BamB